MQHKVKRVQSQQLIRVRPEKQGAHQINKNININMKSSHEVLHVVRALGRMGAPLNQLQTGDVMAQVVHLLAGHLDHVHQLDQPRISLLNW